MNQKLDAILKKSGIDQSAPSPVPKPNPGRCTGCNHKFLEDVDEEPIDECCDCGYMTCESCASHHSRGSSPYNKRFDERAITHYAPIGSCYCQNSNFGVPYCERGTSHYPHMAGETPLYLTDFVGLESPNGTT